MDNGVPLEKTDFPGEECKQSEDHTHQLSPTTTVTWAQQSEPGQQRHMNGLVPARVLIGLTMVLVGEKSEPRKEVSREEPKD